MIVGLDRAWWGRGLAVEAGRALLRHGFHVLGFDGIRGSTDVANVASVRMLERMGMARERVETVGGLPTVFFSIAPARA